MPSLLIITCDKYTNLLEHSQVNIIKYTVVSSKISEKVIISRRETDFGNMIDKILEYNRRFVEEKGYERFITDKYPNKRIAIVTCMDTRLVELLPAALGFRNGDVKIIKNAGATITNPFDSTVRSLLVATYELGVEEVMIIGHTECGVQGMDSAEMQHAMRERGIPEHHITLMKHCGIDLDSWLHGFDDTESAILEAVVLVRNHPLVPDDIVVKGYIMDSITGALRPIG